MTTPNDDLEPFDPSTARKLYLDHKKTYCSEATVQAHRYRTKHIVNWCEEEGIDNLNELTGRNYHEFRLWHIERGDINQVTLRQHMCTLRVFLKWAASIGAVDPELYDKVMVSKISREERKRDTMLDVEDAKEIPDYLGKFHFASRDHALIALSWEAGIRIGAANFIDLDDVDLQEEYVDLEHRPDEGTTLMNGRAVSGPSLLRLGWPSCCRSISRTDKSMLLTTMAGALYSPGKGSAIEKLHSEVYLPNHGPAFSRSAVSGLQSR